MIIKWDNDHNHKVQIYYFLPSQAFVGLQQFLNFSWNLKNPNFVSINGYKNKMQNIKIITQHFCIKG